MAKPSSAQGIIPCSIRAHAPGAYTVSDNTLRGRGSGYKTKVLSYILTGCGCYWTTCVAFFCIVTDCK